MATHGVFHDLPVAAVQPLTADAVVVVFDVPPGLARDFAFTQGQHVTVQWGGVRRNYSICSPVGGPLRIAVKRIPEGEFSAFARERLRPGDELSVMTPTGRFTTPLNPAHRKHYAMAAAGSGITPILSNLTSVLAVEPHSRVTLLYGNRTPGTVMFDAELDALAAAHPGRLRIESHFSRAHVPGATEGRVDADRLRKAADELRADEWFLCGPFGMVLDGRAALLEAGVEPRHVHVELFHLAPAVTPHGAGAQLTAILDGRPVTVPVASHETVLDAMLTVRSDAPYACRGGMCGTCRARLLSGSVEMATNFALEPDQLESGYVLTCQAVPTTPEVAVDYDA